MVALAWTIIEPLLTGSILQGTKLLTEHKFATCKASDVKMKILKPLLYQY